MTTYCTYDVWNLAFPWTSVSPSINADYVWNGESYQKREKVVRVPSEQKLGGKFRQVSKAERRALRDFFDSHKGSLTPFWFPSFRSDMWLTKDCVVGTGTIYVDNNSDLIGLSDVVRHAYDPTTGQRFKISYPTLQSDDSIALTVSPVLTSALSAGTALQRLYLVRFDDDELTIETSDENDSISFASFNFQEVQKETP
jgi:hypothetical protein